MYKEHKNLLNIIGTFPGAFWVLNILQMLEKLAYWCVLLQLPVYLAQKDVPGGLHWEQTIKGVIFFWWALVQNITPIFSGGYSDKIGHRKSLIFSFIFIIAGYIIMGTQVSFFPFLAGTVILGFGSGIFKPALQGALASTLNDKNSSVGWGIYFMLLNLSVFFGPPLSKFLKEISWEAVFLGSAAVFALNFIIIFFIGKSGETQKSTRSENAIDNNIVFKKILNIFLQPRIYWLVILMSGFMIIYMQFYETLPNFIYDWTDTSQIVSILHLPDFMTMKTARGVMISYEWLYNLNAGFIILGVVFVSWIFSGIDRIRVIIIGIIFAAAGLMIAGSSMAGIFTVGGFLIYTFGEMVANPKYADYLGIIAPQGEKSLYLSYLNISFAIGLGGGSLSGGWLYHRLGEKAALAARYLNDYYGVEAPDLSMSLNRLQTITKLNANEVSLLLWNTYHPYILWIPFVLIGLLSGIGLAIYKRNYS